MPEDKAVLVYATFPDANTAEAIGGTLVERGLAACVNIIPGMTSIYVWDGKVQHEREVSMLIKTRAGLADAVIAETKARHPYDTPALVVIDISGGDPAFLDWIGAQTRR
jgi:periplasmic divalent cation tolerance protein